MPPCQSAGISSGVGRVIAWLVEDNLAKPAAYDRPEHGIERETNQALRIWTRRVAPKTVLAQQGGSIGPATDKPKNVGQRIAADDERADADCYRRSPDCYRIDRRKRENKDWHQAIAEAVQRPTMRFVATKTGDQLDLQALHRVRERLVGQRTGIINQIRAFLLERGVAVRQGLRFLRIELPGILAKRTDVLSPRMLHLIEGLADDWHRLDERIEVLSSEIGALACGDPACDRLMTVPGIGPIISSATVAAIGNGAAFSKGRDFGAWLGLVPKQISTGDRTILGKISRRGNRYLRSLFVQAAWVVLVRVGPKHWDRYGAQVLDRG